MRRETKSDAMTRKYPPDFFCSALRASLIQTTSTFLPHILYFMTCRDLVSHEYFSKKLRSDRYVKKRNLENFSEQKADQEVFGFEKKLYEEVRNRRSFQTDAYVSKLASLSSSELSKSSNTITIPLSISCICSS
jgi:hypothetical protein